MMRIFLYSKLRRNKYAGIHWVSDNIPIEFFSSVAFCNWDHYAEVRDLFRKSCWQWKKCTLISSLPTIYFSGLISIATLSEMNMSHLRKRTTYESQKSTPLLKWILSSLCSLDQYSCYKTESIIIISLNLQ